MEKISDGIPPLPEYWHYSLNGRRSGPVPETEIVRLIQDREITEESHVWNRSMEDWKPIGDSKFAHFFRDPDLPPPLTGAAVSNSIVWTLAVAPLIGNVLIVFVALLCSSEAFQILIGFLIQFALNTFLCCLDAKSLKAAGHRKRWINMTWLVPVYMYKRARLLDHNNAYFITWCVSIFLTMAFYA